MKILVVKTSALGDIVHSFPAISFIKHKFPDAIIDWVVEKPFSGLVEAHPLVDRAICIDTKKWRKGLFAAGQRKEILAFWQSLRQTAYDVIFDLQANMKSGLITLLSKSQKKVGYTWDGVSEWPNLLCTNHKIFVPKGINVREDYLFLVKSFFQDPSPFVAPPVVLKLTDEERLQLQDQLALLKLIEKPLVMICPGSNWRNKQLSFESLEKFLELMQSHLQCHYLITWGSHEEKQQAAALQEIMKDSSLCNKVSLPVLQHLMTKMRLVVSMDSLPLHLAATTTVPTFGVFGPSLAARYAPQGLKNHAFQGSCPYGRQFPTRCPILRSCKTGACIRSVTGQQLFESYLAQI